MEDSNLIQQRYEFSEDEKIMMAVAIGKKVRELEVLRREKKSIAAEFEAKIKRLDGEICDTAKKVHDGYEYRYAEQGELFDEDDELETEMDQEADVV